MSTEVNLAKQEIHDKLESQSKTVEVEARIADLGTSVKGIESKLKAH